MVEIREIGAAIQHALSIHPAAPIFTSLPCVGTDQRLLDPPDPGDVPYRSVSIYVALCPSGSLPRHLRLGETPRSRLPLRLQQRIPRRAQPTFADNSRRALPLGLPRSTLAPAAAAKMTSDVIRILARAWLRVFCAAGCKTPPRNKLARHTAAAEPRRMTSRTGCLTAASGRRPAAGLTHGSQRHSAARRRRRCPAAALSEGTRREPGKRCVLCALGPERRPGVALSGRAAACRRGQRRRLRADSPREIGTRAPVVHTRRGRSCPRRSGTTS